MRIIVGCPVAERAWILPTWLHCVSRQEIDAEIELVFVYTASSDETLSILAGAGRGVTILHAPFESTRSVEDIKMHYWRDDHYEKMARLRNQLVAYAYATGAEYFFSLDSDLLLPDPTSLEELVIQHERVPQGSGLAPLVLLHEDASNPAYNFMEWDKGRGPADQHLPAASRVAKRLTTIAPTPTDVIMAAIMMDHQAMLARWEANEQGEDIGWSADADRKGIRRFIYGGMELRHMMKITDDPLSLVTY